MDRPVSQIILAHDRILQLTVNDARSYRMESDHLVLAYALKKVLAQL